MVCPKLKDMVCPEEHDIRCVLRCMIYMVCPEFQMLHRTHFQFQTRDVDNEFLRTMISWCVLRYKI